ncbi:PREDICTED: uncharacterized protein LOC107343139 isoform X1 [Acropora digitifera]|uniref:uncharacterized protein LOC107343139 isoform X1 n=1 Tax=Acropora digitifera TaxID=70779 RepID=UPI00077A94B7|nr:PREDICTED: uncharacterized protein LOC107343139 isoform X1 [Acropora digitifera]
MEFALQCDSLPQFTSKDTSFGASDEKYAKERRPLQKESDKNELETATTRDKKHGERLKAQSRANLFMKAIVQQKAPNIGLAQDTARLCCLLGLKENFFDRLHTFSVHRLHHRSLCEWITIFLQNNSRSLSLEKKSFLTTSLLDAIGFDPSSTAVETIMARSSKGNTQYYIKPCEWAEIFIQDECTYNPSLSSLTPRHFPIPSDLANSWFQLPLITDSEESENDPDLYHVKIMNFVTTESQALKEIHSKLDDILPQSNGMTVLYHGTDHYSAVNILFRGIYLRAGRQNRDFSCGSGFYLTKTLDEAVNWARSTTKKPAILVFHVNRKDLDSAERLDLTNSDERWCEIVNSFRSGRRTAKTSKSVSAYDLIEGPQATMRYDEASCELLWEQKPSSYQMCLISDDFAETFKKSLHSILFWRHDV